MSTQPRDRYVYGLPYEPGHQTFDGHPCYIGMGKGRRKEIHLWYARRQGNPESRNMRFYSYLANCLTRGVELAPYIIASNMTIDEAASVEVALITHYGRVDNGGCLLNLDRGGFGGGDRAPSTGLHISAALTGRPRDAEAVAKTAAWHTGRKRPATTKRSISKANKGRPKSAAHRAAISASLTGKARSADSRAKQSAATIGRQKSMDTRAKMANAAVARELAKRGGRPPPKRPRPSRLTNPRI